MYHHAVCKKCGLFLVTFQNKKQKKRERKEQRKKIIFYFYIIIYCVRSMSCFTFLCLCVWFLPAFQYRTPKKKKQKKKFDNRLFSLVCFVFPNQGIRLLTFINYSYICAWMHVHGRHLEETVLWATITWSEMGKTYRTYKLKRSIPTCYH